MVSRPLSSLTPSRTRLPAGIDRLVVAVERLVEIDRRVLAALRIALGTLTIYGMLDRDGPGEDHEVDRIEPNKYGCDGSYLQD